MDYHRVNWVEEPDTRTPINAENLNNMDKGLADAAAELAAQTSAIDALGEAIEGAETDIQYLEQSKVAENLLSTPYYYATSRVIAGITWTVYSDGTIEAHSADGKGASARSDFYLKNRTASGFYLKPGTYILSGCPEGGTYNSYFMWGSTNTGNIFNNDFGNGRVQEITDQMEGIGIYCSIAAGYAPNHLLFKPMIEIGETKHEWQPYALSREGLRTKRYTSGNYVVEVSPDGYKRMIYRKDVRVDLTLPSGGIYWGEVSLENFPENFSQKPTVVYSVMANGNNAWGWGKSAPTISNPGAMYLAHDGTAVQQAALTIVAIAEGY